MNTRANWGHLPDYSHQNWTGRTPRVGSWSVAKGSYAPGSERIPRLAWVAAVVVGMFAVGVAFVGAAVGF